MQDLVLGTDRNRSGTCLPRLDATGRRPLASTRVEAVVDLVVVGAVDVRVLEGGIEADVTKKVTEVVKVHAILKQMRREGMPEDARVERTRDTRTQGVFAHQCPEANAPHARPVASGEEARILWIGQPLCSAVFEVVAEGGNRHRRHGHHAFSPRSNLQEGEVEKEIVHIQSEQFVDLESAGVEQFEHRLIPESKVVIGRGCVEQGGHLLWSEQLWGFRQNLRKAHAMDGVGRDQPLLVDVIQKQLE